MSAAQSAAINGAPFSFSFVNTGMVGLDGEKMSKSKGNLVFVSKLLTDGVDPMVIRYALLGGHYSSDRMWTDDLLEHALSEVSAIRSALSREVVAETLPVVQSIANFMADDLDTVSALNAIVQWSKATQAGETGGSAGELSRAMDLLLGLAL
jgi:L-cysteine:1D-myo-inositol 2-amino-2-deoxy-alpha-D-glucopyranoside ligase